MHEWDEAQSELRKLDCIERARTLASRDGAAMPPALRAPPPDALPGYALGPEIHRGGQGIVYRATERSTGRAVAIRVMSQGLLAATQDRARFEREVEILGQLQHPGIVTIHDSGATAEHTFFVMDLIEGRPLDDDVRSELGALMAGEARRWGMDRLPEPPA